LEPFAPSPQRDPEFEAGPPIGADSLAPPIAPETYLRLVANPFLMFVGLVVWLLLGRWVLGLLRRNPDLIGPLAPILVVLLLASLWLLPGLSQYHCLDCGGTGRLSRWRRHACPRSVGRRIQGESRRLRGPSPFYQVLLWLWALLAAGVFVLKHLPWRP
jgi:branched-subunit amino acid ABC-type transport system permease component